MNSFITCLVTFLALEGAGRAQVVSGPPKGWTETHSIYAVPGGNINRLNLTNNTPEAIRKEILDTNTLRLIARFNGISDEDLATVQIIQERGFVELCQIGNLSRAYKVISEQLIDYAVARDAGHTRDFCRAAITNKTDISSVVDPFLRAFLKEHPKLPADRLTMTGSTLYTNKAGTIAGETSTTTFVNGKFETTHSKEIPKVDEVGQRITYILIDGEIAWNYTVQFRPDQSVHDVTESRGDAKEYDPKYSQTIKEAKDQAIAELQKAGTYGFLRSGGVFSSLVRKKLKEQGIDWQSFEDFNPNFRY